ncbi:MAG: type IV secretion system protein VirB10 [Lautropia sp.]
MSNINDQKPLPPVQPATESAAPQAPGRPAGGAADARISGVQSVNSRGGRAGGAGPRLFMVGCLAIVLVITGLMFYRSHQREKAAMASAEKAMRDARNAPAAVSMRRTFDPTIPAPPPPKVTATECRESKEMRDENGKVVLSVTGAPMRLCDDGRVFIPRQEPPRLPPPPAIVRAPAPAPAASSKKEPSRYGGATVLPSLDELAQVTAKVAGPNQLSTQENYQRLLGGESPDGGMQRTAYAGDGRREGTTPMAPPREGMMPVQLAQVGPPPAAAPAARAPVGEEFQREPAPGAAGRQQRGAIGSILNPSGTPRVDATMLGDQSMILPRGRTIDCALGTSVVTEVSGMAECIITSNVYSDNGRVLLIERGSQASGEYRADMAMGQRRLFLLWNRIKTPNGVVIDLNSPASDPLGASGLPGYIDNRWVDRIGAALLVSLVQDALAYGIERARSRDSDSVYVYNSTPTNNFTTTESTGTRIVEEILRQTLQIRPTLYKNQGDRAAIYVARDLDFSPVYEVRGR